MKLEILNQIQNPQKIWIYFTLLLQNIQKTKYKVFHQFLSLREIGFLIHSQLVILRVHYINIYYIAIIFIII